MTTAGPLNVIVVGRSPEKMRVATAVLDSHGFAATGVFSEDEARLAIAEEEQLLAVVAGGSIDEAGRDRLRVGAVPKGAVLITASIGHDDPKVYFTDHVIPKLVEATGNRHDRRNRTSGATGPTSDLPDLRDAGASRGAGIFRHGHEWPYLSGSRPVHRGA